MIPNPLYAMKTFITILTTVSFGLAAMAQNGIQWQQSLGGSSFDFSKEIEPATDGGYIAVGYSQSNDGDFMSGYGAGDCRVSKLGANGSLEWTKNYGGNGFDFGYSIKASDDNGYVMVGYTESNDGDVTMQHGAGDFWVLKLDSVGTIVWQKTFGGAQTDKAQSVQQTSDGGMVVVGYTESVDGDVSGNHGGGDCWAIKLDANGNVQWQKCLGGSGYDFAQAVIETTDGNYVIVGGTNSCNGNVSLQHGNGDCWMVKLNTTGAILWQKSIGGSDYDYPQAIQETADGGLIVAAYTQSADGDVAGAYGNGDCWVVKCDASGTIQWQRVVGGSGNDYAYSIKQNNAGDYVMVGYSEINDGDVSGNHGNYDCWMVQLSASGQLLVQQSFGGSSVDIAYDVCETADGAYVIAGYSESMDGDVTSNHGGGDCWLIKVNSMSVGLEEIVPETLVVAPNPSAGVFNFLNVADESFISIYSLTGALVMEAEMMQGNHQIDLSNTAKGIYYYKIEDKKGSIVTGKLMLN